MGQMSDSEQCSNRLELDLISLLVNFSCELKLIVIQVQWALPIKNFHLKITISVVCFLPKKQTTLIVIFDLCVYYL